MPLAKAIGQGVVVEDKPGASGNIAYRQVALARKDGPTLLVSYSACHVGNPAMSANLPWAQKDLAPSALLTAATNVIAAHPSMLSHTLKAFAVTGKRCHPGLPNVPTTAKASRPGFELEAWVGLFAPAGAPPAVIAQLSETVKLALATPDAQQAARRQGIEIRYLGLERFSALVATDTAYWGNPIESHNITAD